MTKPDLYWKDYRHIAAWNRFMGTDENTEEDQRAAASVQAPIDSLYVDDMFGYVTFSELTETGVKRIIENFIEDKKDEQ